MKLLIYSPYEVLDDSVWQRHAGRLFQALDVDLLVNPLYPPGALRAAVEEHEAVDHGRAAVGEAGEDVGAEADAEADTLGEAVVVEDVLDLME
jgi:hypothetical protein